MSSPTLPVFVDDTGRRRTLSRRFGRLLVLGFVAYLALLAAGVARDPRLGPLALPTFGLPELIQPERAPTVLGEILVQTGTEGAEGSGPAADRTSTKTSRTEEHGSKPSVTTTPAVTSGTSPTTSSTSFSPGGQPGPGSTTSSPTATTTSTTNGRGSKPSDTTTTTLPTTSTSTTTLPGQGQGQGQGQAQGSGTASGKGPEGAGPPGQQRKTTTTTTPTAD